MIDYLYIENFKCITKQKFEFSRINIFCGPNNSGKSTVLAVLNLIAQTLHDNPTDASLVLNGKYENLGTFHDFIRNHNIRSKFCFEIGLGSFNFRYEYKYRTQRREIELIGFSLRENDKPIYSYISKEDNYDVKIGGKSLEKFETSKSKRRPFIKGLILLDMVLRSLRMSGTHHSKQLESNIEDNKYSDEINTFINADRTLMKAFSRLRRAFDGFDTLGAFRERPTRTYMFSGESPIQVGRTGASAIDMLVSDKSRRGSQNKNLVRKTSEWFIKSGMAAGLEINALTSRHYEICIKDESKGQHNLCDVGFGCSQVLPVLVSTFAFESRNAYDELGGGSILIIQEPEIHLHPNAQAELGTLFANASQAGQIFIETHSPYLILRLQSEVAQEHILANSINTFYVQRKKDGAAFTHMHLLNNGLFKDKWPEGFFPHRHEETLNLARFASKKLTKSSSNNSSPKKKK
ncbi:MAG: hypothetical protein A3J37_08845 [Alphaproteobacteria bacterium RIFCSPHIGHO2_12_FULL_45_9]|nr:MAG: hypothetical protein A3B66_05875 [Alphaproteobacteria bacterium RIFCSPHIGHO2_02_FULL_46_13]OFW94729.1 MAG: hypothetical protein A3J37_08845 [Alphaproteobacteria bacterium RIFCSPHIGHO2_12_FULL_45_9]